MGVERVAQVAEEVDVGTGFNVVPWVLPANEAEGDQCQGGWRGATRLSVAVLEAYQSRSSPSRP